VIRAQRHQSITLITLIPSTRRSADKRDLLVHSVNIALPSQGKENELPRILTRVFRSNYIDFAVLKSHRLFFLGTLLTMNSWDRPCRAWRESMNKKCGTEDLLNANLLTYLIIVSRVSTNTPMRSRTRINGYYARTGALCCRSAHGAMLFAFTIFRVTRRVTPVIKM